VTEGLADAHLHLFRAGFTGRYGRGPYGMGNEVEIYERFRQVHGIAAGLIVGYEGERIEPDNNRYIRSLAGIRPWMRTLAYVAPAAAPDEAAIDALMDQGHVGITIYLPDTDSAQAILAWPDSGWNRLDERGAVISLNAVPEAIELIDGRIAAGSNAAFLLSHLGLPGRFAETPSPDVALHRLAPILKLAATVNVLVKISGLYAVSDPPHRYPHDTATPIIAALLRAFGAHRCCWGSDFSPSLDFISFAQAVDIPALDSLSTTDRARVMGGNLLELLNA
jgi:predicted TIM-barrel fold metal-dependent hydrolase